MVRNILFLASNPTDTGRLRLDKEHREIDEGLRRSNERDRFNLLAKFAVRIDDLRRSLLDHCPRIVHFAGHGEGAAGILLENDLGQSVPVPNNALAGLFKLCANHVECVVLNACYSDVQAEAIGKYIPYVVGMRADVSDEAALEFAVAFYDALGAGKAIEEAFRFGRNAIAMKGIPEHLTPVLRIKDLTAEEKQRLESSHSPARHVFMDVSVLNDDTSSWNRGNDTILRYSLARNEQRIIIDSNLGYLDSFNAGGPIGPLSYMSPTLCPFRWGFPTLDFKILNNRTTALFLTEVVFDIEESRANQSPLLAIRRDVQQRHAGDLLLVNEGWCDLVDLTISFNLSPGDILAPLDIKLPYQHSINLPLLVDSAEIDVTPAFQKEGVDIVGLILLTNGEWESRETFVVQTADGSEERITPAQMQERTKKCLGRFQDYVGTLTGEIGFSAGSMGQRHSVQFWAPVYIANENRRGIPKPVTSTYDIVFDAQKTAYQKRVQISHELQPGEADRFTVKVAVAQSSSHRFRATVCDITGQAFQSLPIELNCFVPRSRRSQVELLLKAQR
jgi:hypothetical protein